MCESYSLPAILVVRGGRCILLFTAPQRSVVCVQVIPIYCFDPRQFGGTPRGNPKTGLFRAKFVLESVLALQSSLRALGSDLLIANGTPEDILTGSFLPGARDCVHV